MIGPSCLFTTEKQFTEHFLHHFGPHEPTHKPETTDADGLAFYSAKKTQQQYNVSFLVLTNMQTDIYRI